MAPTDAPLAAAQGQTDPVAMHGGEAVVDLEDLPLVSVIRAMLHGRCVCPTFSPDHCGGASLGPTATRGSRSLSLDVAERQRQAQALTVVLPQLRTERRVRVVRSACLARQ